MRKTVSVALALGTFLATTPAVGANVAFTGSFSNDTPPPTANPACLPAQVFVNFNPGNSTAAGLSNLGAFGPSQSHCINVPPAPYTGIFSFDFGARGILQGTTSGFLTPSGTANILNSFVTYTVAGGTGAFAGATGIINGVGTLDRNFARPRNQLALSGTLNAPGVPEPASWGMMITGFGAVGGMTRRRRARKLNPSTAPA